MAPASAAPTTFVVGAASPCGAATALVESREVATIASVVSWGAGDTACCVLGDASATSAPAVLALATSALSAFLATRPPPDRRSTRDREECHDATAGATATDGTSSAPRPSSAMAMAAGAATPLPSARLSAVSAGATSPFGPSAGTVMDVAALTAARASVAAAAEPRGGVGGRSRNAAAAGAGLLSPLARPQRHRNSRPVSVCTSRRNKFTPQAGQGICSFSEAATSCAASAAQRLRRNASKQRGQKAWAQANARIASPPPTAREQTAHSKAGALPAPAPGGNCSLVTSTASVEKT
mmetsp:Transcript_71035/g.159521  ORF Transcript_71035/g.159521 Transcript_71035/m.159521 type:complete len:296 (-) Transcript_71035:22-909(-)